MKLLLPVLLAVWILSGCSKNDNSGESNTNHIDTTLCLDTTFLRTNIHEGLLSVFFVNADYGFVGGFAGGIYKTTDGGRLWSRLNTQIDVPVYGLYFLDANKGFAVGGQNSCGGTGCVIPGGFILETLDGGVTWQKVYTPSTSIEISSICFVSPSTGFCAGDNMILKTTDGGKTWSEYRIDGLGGKMMQIAFSDANNGYIAAMFDRILRTTDAGLHWEVTNNHFNVGYYSVSPAGGSIVYMSGQGKVIKSTNGGATWSELPNSPSDLFAIHFLDDQKGFAFGRGNYSGGDFGTSYGSIYCTSDGGKTWSGSAQIREISMILAVSFPTDKTAYAVSGNHIVKLTAQ